MLSRFSIVGFNKTVEIVVDNKSIDFFPFVINQYKNQSNGLWYIENGLLRNRKYEWRNDLQKNSMSIYFDIRLEPISGSNFFVKNVPIFRNIDNYSPTIKIQILDALKYNANGHKGMDFGDTVYVEAFDHSPFKKGIKNDKDAIILFHKNPPLIPINGVN